MNLVTAVVDGMLLSDGTGAGMRRMMTRKKRMGGDCQSQSLNGGFVQPTETDLTLNGIMNHLQVA